MSKTKWKLAEALKKLMKEKSLHKITIQDIVEESGLTRQSFYYHFHDICEIIEWICKNTLLEKCDVEEKTPDCWIYTLFENAHADRNFYRKVIREFGRELLEKAVITDVEERMKRMLSIYKIEEKEVLTFLTTSLLNYVIIVAETYDDKIGHEQIEHILLFLKNGMQEYCHNQNNVQCA